MKILQVDAALSEDGMNVSLLGLTADPDCIFAQCIELPRKLTDSTFHPKEWVNSANPARWFNATGYGPDHPDEVNGLQTEWKP